MHNIKLTIEYDGTNYCGWQKQKIKIRDLKERRKTPSIQETIESCLKKILREEIHLIASGRTDSGVHALGQVANFRTASKMESGKVKLALNANLPYDIRIAQAEYVALEFHSRYSAKSKAYRYIILNQDCNSPFLENYSYWFRSPLNIKLMEKAAASLLGRHDFKVFCASGSGVKDTTRTIKRLSVTSHNFLHYNLICFEVEADGFLYNMVRNIVGTLVEIGRGRFKPSCIKEIFKRKNKALVGPCAPSKGLYLLKVKY